MGFNGDMARILWETGVMLIEDDKHDLGYLSYWGRKNHRYHGEVRPDHPSPFHHYQLGSLFCIMSQMLGAVDLMQETQSAYKEYQQQAPQIHNLPARAPGSTPVPRMLTPTTSRLII